MEKSVTKRTLALNLYRLTTALALVVVVLTLLNWAGVADHMAANSPLGIPEARVILGITTALSCVTLVLYPILSEGIRRPNPRNRKTRSIIILGVIISLGLIQPVVSSQLPEWMRVLRFIQIVTYLSTVAAVVALRKQGNPVGEPGVAV